MQLKLLWLVRSGELAEYVVESTGEEVDYENVTYLVFESRRGNRRCFTEERIKQMIESGEAKEVGA